MDSYGKIALVVVLVAFFGGAYGLRFLANHTPRWTVLATALVLLALSAGIDPKHSRELAGLVDVLRVLSLFGITYGISVFRKKGS